MESTFKIFENENEFNKLFFDMLSKYTKCEVGLFLLYRENKLVLNCILGNDDFQFTSSSNDNVLSFLMNSETVSIALHSGMLFNWHCEEDTFHSSFKYLGNILKREVKSVLIIPLINYEQKVKSMVILVNACDSNNNKIRFTADHIEKAERICNIYYRLNEKNISIEQIEDLFSSFVASIATALDKKSPHTYEHIEKVKELTLMIAKAVNDDDEYFYDIYFSEDELKELEISAYLHDIGKITTPAHILEKNSKLFIPHDRINLIQTRINFLLSILNGDNYKISENTNIKKLEEFAKKLELLNKATFIKKTDEELLNEMRSYKFPFPLDQMLLEDDEHELLSIKKGNLTSKEKKVMNDHVVETSNILDKVNFPEKYKKVRSFSKMHHEKLSGCGYPEGVYADKIPLEARIITFADIFEALTAPDRPYRDAKLLSEALSKIVDMTKKFELDFRIFNLFMKRGIYADYCQKYVNENQIDPINVYFHHKNSDKLSL